LSGSVAAQHLRELVASKSKAYELLLSLDQNTSADQSCFQSLARIVDRLLFNEISLDGAALRDLGALVSAPAEDLSSTLAVLDVALSEAEPERGSMQLLLARFQGWLAAASNSARPHFLAILPNIASHLKELGNSGVESLIACFNWCPSSEDSDVVARCIVRYQETSGEIISASAKLGSLFLRQGAGALVERMLIAIPPETMFDSKEARALLPAIAKLQSAGAGDPVWSAAAAACLAVAKHNHSSALNLTRQLPNAFAPLPAESRVAYLKAFESIIDEAGISMVGYGIGSGAEQLPALFQKAGVDRAGAFVGEGMAIAHRYGKVAAQEFFEQKTPASRQAAPVA
jgi:hypothetical protein